MKDTIIKILGILPVLAFFIVYKSTGDLVNATAVIVGGCLFTSLIEFVLNRSVSRMQLFMLCAVLIFGIPTVLLQDPSIIKWKVTVVNLIFALLLFIFTYIVKRNPLSYLLGREIKLPDDCWHFLAKGWMIFFTFAALLTVVIAFYLPAIFGISPESAESLWVDYKTFGNAILNFLFCLVCIGWMVKNHPELLNELKK